MSDCPFSVYILITDLFYKEMTKNAIIPFFSSKWQADKHILKQYVV